MELCKKPTISKQLYEGRSNLGMSKKQAFFKLDYDKDPTWKSGLFGASLAAAFGALLIWYNAPNQDSVNPNIQLRNPPRQIVSGKSIKPETGKGSNGLTDKIRDIASEARKGNNNKKPETPASQAYIGKNSIIEEENKTIKPPQKRGRKTLEGRVDNFFLNFNKNKEEIINDYRKKVYSNFGNITANSIDDQIKLASGRYMLPYDLLHLLADKESNSRQFYENGKKKGKTVTSRSGAVGLFQLKKIAVKQIYMDSFGKSYKNEQLRKMMQPLIGGGYERELTDLCESLNKDKNNTKGNTYEIKKKEKVLNEFLGVMWEAVKKSAAANAEFGTAYKGHCLIKSDEKPANQITAKELAYALSGYNAGNGSVRKAKGIPKNGETIDYVQKIGNTFLKPYGLYIVAPKETMYNLTKRGKIFKNKEDLFRLNPQVEKDYYNNGEDFTKCLKANDILVTREGANPNKPLFRLVY